MKYWVGALTFVVVLLGVGYLNLYCCRMQFDGNSAGIIISALGILVTALVGWQIWQTIVSRDELKEARAATKSINAIEEKVNQIVPMTDAHFQLTLANTMQ